MRAATTFSLLGCAVISACSNEAARFAHEPNDTWFRDVNVVSLERPNVLPNANVVIRGDTVAYVGTVAPTPGSVRATVFDGKGRFLIPGRIDGHVHLAAIPGPTTEQQTRMPDIVAAYYERLPRSYLYFGLPRCWTSMSPSVTSSNAFVWLTPPRP